MRKTEAEEKAEETHLELSFSNKSYKALSENEAMELRKRYRVDIIDFTPTDKKVLDDIQK